MPMTPTILAVTLTGLLLIWRLLLDYVPMRPLNDLAQKSPRIRKRDWTIHYAPLFAALVLSLIGARFTLLLSLIIIILYTAAQLVSWWWPYLKGGSVEQKARWTQQYGRTHRFLPGISDHSVPVTSQVMTGVLTILVLIGLVSGLTAGKADSKEVTAPLTQASPSPGATTDKPALIETAFTQAGQKPEQVLIAAFNNAKSTLDIAINAINHEDIVKAIIEARIRGVQIRVITDRSESTNVTQQEKLKNLLQSGIPVKENSRKGLMDLKMAVIDGEVGATGSFNYTTNAATANDEILVIIRDKTAVNQWKTQFEAMWNDTVNFRELQVGVVQKK